MPIPTKYNGTAIINKLENDVGICENALINETLATTYVEKQIHGQTSRVHLVAL